MSLTSIQRHQLSRIARQIASTAMTIELAADRGDWETVHDAHGRLIGLYGDYRATYVWLLVEGAHRDALGEGPRSGVESADSQTYSGLSDSMSC